MSTRAYPSGCEVIPQKDLDGFHPGFIDFPGADLLNAVTQVEPNKADQFVALPGGGSLFQKWNGHAPLIYA
jgi:hypothetical protein